MEGDQALARNPPGVNLALEPEALNYYALAA